jgi:hypothetical protein
MFANVKKIKKPIQKQDFYMPSGEPVPPDRYFLASKGSRYHSWQFKYLSITRGYELAKDGVLIIRQRVEIKAEIRKTFRNGGKVSSKSWHLASILERDVSDPIKCEAFWRKIDDKLKIFDLSEAEELRIRAKIESHVPKLSSGQ